MLIAGIVGSRLAGYPYRDGAVGGDFTRIFSLARRGWHSVGSMTLAPLKRALNSAPKVIRDNWDEAQSLVERIVAERTIRFDAPANDAWREHLDAQYGREKTRTNSCARSATATW